MISVERYNRQAKEVGIEVNHGEKSVVGFIEDCLDTLKERNMPSSEKKLKRCTPKQQQAGVVYEGETLDYYYVCLINDVIAQIRTGKKGYLFTLKQIKDLIRFTPDVSIRFVEEDECFEIEEV